jgi:hypothetical protein
MAIKLTPKQLEYFGNIEEEINKLCKTENEESSYLMFDWGSLFIRKNKLVASITYGSYGETTIIDWNQDE